MPALGYHVVFRMGDDRVIAASIAERRRWARRLCALAVAFPIVSWKLADTHLHIVVFGESAELIRRLRIWVTRALRIGVPLEVQRNKPLADQSHAQSAFSYVLRQDDKHGVETDVHQDASAVLDILGLRRLTPELPLRVRERFPRLRREALVAHLGVPSLEEEVHEEHAFHAACAAFGLETLRHDAVSTRARVAAVAALRGRPPSAIAAALHITPQAVWLLAKRPPPDPRDVRAVRLQMALRAARSAASDFAAAAVPRSAPPLSPARPPPGPASAGPSSHTPT
jgi:hypothetical protein